MKKQSTFLPKANNIKLKYLLDPKWKSFEEAREYARGLNLISAQEWYRFSVGKIHGLKKAYDIPSNPRRVYKLHGWSGYADWLGFTPSKNMKYLPFSVARKFIRNLQIENIAEWKLYCHGNLSGKGVKPKHIPSTPNSVYQKQWISWLDWLGNGIVKYKGRYYEPFTDARAFTHSLKFENIVQWYKYCSGELITKIECPQTIPTFPHEVYRNYGWVSWRDWLGNSLKPNDNYRTFEEAKTFAIALRLKSGTEWRKYCSGVIINKVHLPEDIPSRPDHYYKAWISWGDFLGTETEAAQNKKFRPFLDARNFIRQLHLSGNKEWRVYCKGVSNRDTLPADIPANPQRTYQNEWQGWMHWLGKS